MNRPASGSGLTGCRDTGEHPALAIANRSSCPEELLEDSGAADPSGGCSSSGIVVGPTSFDDAFVVVAVDDGCDVSTDFHRITPIGRVEVTDKGQSHAAALEDMVLELTVDPWCGSYLVMDSAEDDAILIEDVFVALHFNGQICGILWSDNLQTRKSHVRKRGTLVNYDDLLFSQGLKRR